MTESADLWPRELHLRGPADIVAAVPYLLGYHPDSCLVLVGVGGTETSPDGLGFLGVYRTRPLRAARGARAGRAARDGRLIAAQIAGDASDYGARTVILVAYGPAADLPAQCAERACRSLGVEVADVIVVADGRWRSVLCTDPDCCPPDGVAILPAAAPGGPSRVAAICVAAGLAVRESRESLAEQIRPASDAQLEAMQEAIRNVEADLAATGRLGSEEGRAGYREETLARFAALLEVGEGAPVQPEDREAARVLAGLQDRTAQIWCADACLPAGPEAATALAVLCDLARRAPATHAEPVVAMVAFQAHRMRDVALSRVALDRLRRLSVTREHLPRTVRSRPSGPSGRVTG